MAGYSNQDRGFVTSNTPLQIFYCIPFSSCGGNNDNKKCKLLFPVKVLRAYVQFRLFSALNIHLNIQLNK